MNLALRVAARFWLPLTLALLAAITLLSLTPQLGEEGDVVRRTDKLQHLFAYGALAFPAALARPRGWIWILAGLAAWSGAIELIQPLANRSANWFDFGTNVAGVACGAIAAWGLRRLVRFRAEPKQTAKD